MLAKMRCRPHRFACVVDALPAELIPRHVGRDRAADGELVVSSTFRFEPGGDLPADIRQRLAYVDGLERSGPLAWTEDPGTGVWMPLCVRGEWSALLATLRPGAPAPADLPAPIRQALAETNVLVRPDAERRRRAAWDEICRDAGDRFRRLGYAIVRDLIHPVHVAALRRYYRALVASGRLPMGDDQVAERYRLHSEPVAMFIHPQLAGLVSRIAGEPVVPSYLYFASYPGGSALPRHVDRPQCEFSISVLVDYSPEPNGPCGWPLFLEDPSRPADAVAADLSLGDAVFYRGRQLVHYRDRLPDEHRSSSLFFHYVRPDFIGDTF